MRLSGVLVSIMTLLPFVARAGGTAGSANDSLFTINGVADFSLGQIVHGKYGVAPLNGFILNPQFQTVNDIWEGNPLGRLNLSVRPGDGITILLGIQGNIGLNTFPPNLKKPDYTVDLPSFYDYQLHQAQGIFSLHDDGTTKLALSIGYMPYKYNEDANNLGEYLFRTGTYPFYIVNEYNFPLARLSGIRLNYQTASDETGFRADLFALSERDMPPFNDLSFAAIIGANFFRKILDIGAGVEFAHAIAADPSLTTPSYQNGAEPISSGSGVHYISSITSKAGVFDTTYGTYTFAGTKLMARASLDLPNAFGVQSESPIGQLMGKTGGKLYGEIAIIGLKNYPAGLTNIDGDNPWGYMEITQRMPFMFGIDIPAWKIFDVLSFELEKYPAPYPNDYYNVVSGQNLPLPMLADTGGAYSYNFYSSQRWYWSLYGKREIVRNLSIVGQIAHDHERWQFGTGNENNYSFEEALVLPGQWAWHLGFLYQF